MPSKPENRIYHTFKSWVKRDGFLHVFEDIKLHRIESHGELGIPDIYFELPVLTGWIEQKYINWPKRSSTNIKLDWQPGQINWGYKHDRFVNNQVSVYRLAVLDNLGTIRLFKWPFISEEYTQEQFNMHGKKVTNIKEVVYYLKH